MRTFKNKKLILASKSPRRCQILTDMGYLFSVIPSEYNENLPSVEFRPETVQEIALGKALDVSKHTDKNTVILAADTLVVHNDEVLGKPHSHAEAFKMLKKLSGDRHYVVTGICLIDNYTGRIFKDFIITYVTFSKLTDKMIRDYIKLFNPLDKAGAYGIQELPNGFVENIEGEVDNVIGLPSKAVENLFNKANII